MVSEAPRLLNNGRSYDDSFNAHQLALALRGNILAADLLQKEITGTSPVGEALTGAIHASLHLLEELAAALEALSVETAPTLQLATGT